MLASLVSGILLLGMADAVVGSYLVLYASDELRLEPTAVAVVVSAPSVGGIALSWVTGRLFDRRPTRLWAVLAALCGATGLLLMTTTRSFPLLVLIAVVLLGAHAAAAPQLFALGRVALGKGRLGHRVAPVLRSAWSLAWAIGPLLGAVVLAAAGYVPLFVVAAGLLGLAAVAPLAAPLRESDEGPPDVASGRPEGRPALLPLFGFVVGVLLFFGAMYAGSLALPLLATRELHLPAASVGLLYSVCAIVEVVAALALAAVPERVGSRLLAVGGMAIFVIYFGVVAVASGLPALILAQLARGTAIAVVGSAGLRHVQDLLAPRVGRASVLFTNATAAGALLSGSLGGVTVQAFGSRTALWACGGTALVAALLAAATSRAGARHVDRRDGGPP